MAAEEHEGAVAGAAAEAVREVRAWQARTLCPQLPPPHHQPISVRYAICY